MSILSNIKQRPDNEKKIFSLITAALLTLVIVVVWFSFTDENSSVQITGEQDNKLSSISPMQVIKDEFSKAFVDFNNKVADAGSSASTSVDSISEDPTISTSTLAATSTIPDKEIKTQATTSLGTSTKK